MKITDLRREYMRQVVLADDDLDVDSCRARDADRGALTVDQHDDDGEVRLQQGLQNRAGARRKHSDPPHDGNVAEKVRPGRAPLVLELWPGAWSDTRNAQAAHPVAAVGGRAWT
jgi:hypothetical protein